MNWANLLSKNIITYISGSLKKINKNLELLARVRFAQLKVKEELREYGIWISCSID